MFNSSIRKSIYNVHESETTLHPKLRCYTASQLRRSVTLLGYREISIKKVTPPNAETPVETITEEKKPMWHVPSNMDISQLVSPGTPGCEPFLSKAGMFKVQRNKIAPLVVHKKLINESNGKPTGTHDDTFLKALLVSGGYRSNTRVLLGAAPIGDPHCVDHYVTIPPAPHNKCAVTVKNPFYCATGNIGMNLLFDAPDEELDPTNLNNANMVPDDPMFPKHMEYVSFNENSQLEENLVKAAHETLYNNPCPPDFLPSYTNYL